MKRSDMVKSLGKYLFYKEDSINLGSIEDHEEFADRVLDFIEKEGMSPPFDLDVYLRSNRLPGDGNKWSPEDEQEWAETHTEEM